MRCYLTTLLVVTFSGAGWVCAGSSYPDAEVDIDSLKATVQYLAELEPARSYENIESINKAATYISNKFTEYGLKPIEQRFDAQGETYKNIIASVGPEKGRRLIVGAHYDVCGDQPGADDNASGVAGLLEVARFAKINESNLTLRVDFVAYTLEEPPFYTTEFMGSYVHAKSLHDAKVDVRGMISLEMIGFYSDKKKSQRYPLSIMRLFYPGKGNFIAAVGNYGSSSLVKKVAKHMRHASIKVRTLKAPKSFGGIGLSDHRSYWEFGYDAMMVTDTSFFRNQHYHETSDTPDTLDYKKMQEVVKGVCWAIMNIK